MKATNALGININMAYRYARYIDGVGDVSFNISSAQITSGASWNVTISSLTPQTKYALQCSYYSSTYNLIDRNSAEIVTFTTTTPTYVTVTIPAKTTYAQNVVYKYYSGSAGQSTYTHAKSSTATINVETNSTIYATCNPTSTYLQSTQTSTNIGTSNITLAAVRPQFRTPTLNSLTNSPDDTIIKLNYQSPVGCYLYWTLTEGSSTLSGSAYKSSGTGTYQHEFQYDSSVNPVLYSYYLGGNSNIQNSYTGEEILVPEET